MRLVLLIVLILVVFGSFPIFPYNRGWGYTPFGGLLILLLILLFLFGGW